MNGPLQPDGFHDRTIPVESLEPTADSVDFDRWYGPWDPVHPSQVAKLLSGLVGPWWVAGGWAIDAFTQLPREHEDTDISIFRRDLPALRELLAERFLLWSAGSGMLRPLNRWFPETHADSNQIWIRADHSSPWVADILLADADEDHWICRRDPDAQWTLDEVTWVGADGVRYLNPEMALLFKCRDPRPKDVRDFHRVWPLLSGAQRSWLARTVQRLYPEHPWLAVMLSG